MKAVTDPELLRQLDGGDAPEKRAPGKLVTDERILFELNNAPKQEESKPGIAQRLLRQAGLTARAGIEGLTALPAMIADVPAALYNKAADALHPRTMSSLITGEKGYRFPAQQQAISGLLTRLGLPVPESATERVAGDVAGAMTGQGGVVALGKGMVNATAPVTQRVGALLASNPALQTTAAAAGPSAGGVVREQGGSPGAQLAANLGATIATPMAAGTVKTAPIPRSIKDVMAEAQRRNVDLSYADITQGGGVRRLDTMLEQAPVVGTSGFREQGAKKVTAAIEGFSDDALASMQATPYRRMNELTSAAAAGDKAARATLDQIKNAGSDWTKVMQASGNLKLWRSKQAADQLYDRVADLARTRGEVPLPATNAAIDAAIAAESKSVLPDKDLLAKLQQIKDGLYGPQQSPKDFNSIRQLRSDLGNIIDSYFKGGNAAVGGKGVGNFQAVKNAVEADMEKFATTSGDDLARAWRRADSFYKNAVVPFKDRALAQALKSDLPDEIYKRFIQVSRSGAGEDRAIKFYDALDPKGRAAVRYGMIANAVESAAIPERGALLSPGKFEQSLQNIDPAASVFFKGAAKKELDAFVNLMEHSRRFGQYLENPPTGQRVIPWLALGGAALRPTEMAGVGAGALVATKLMTTTWGKDLLLRASQARAGTPEMQRVVEEIGKQIPRILSQPESRTNIEQSAQSMTSRSTPAAAGTQ